MISNPAERRAWSRYAIAVLSVALAAGVRAGLLGSLGTRSPFVTFYPAVILATLFGGLPCGLLATALSILTVNFFWVEPVGQFSIQDPADWLSAGAFVVGCTMICFVSRAMQQAQARATEAEAQVRLTERNRAEEELHRYKLLAEHSRDIILYLRRDDGRILEANAAATAYGYTRDELLSLSIHDLRAASAQQLTESQMVEADLHGILFETVHRCRDGRTFPVEVSSQGATIGGTRTLVSVVRDIAGRKLAEEALRGSELRLRSVSDNLPEAVMYRYCLSSDGKPHFEFLSAGIERLTGIPAAEFMSDAATIERSIVPDDHERMREAIKLSRDRLTQFEIEVRRRHRLTGEVQWSLLRSTPFRNPDGSTTWDGIELDITARKQAEEALRENRERLQAALASMADAVFISDAEGRFIEFNDAFATYYRFRDRQECVRTFAEYSSIIDVFLPDGTPAPPEMWAVARALRGETATNAEYGLRRKDTGETWFGSYSFAPIRDKNGAVTGSVVVARDISDRKQADQALRESEEKFRTLANAIPQLCWMANADGWIFWYNERWYRYTGTSPEQMEGWGWQSVHDPAMLPKVLERWQASIATGEPFDMVFPLRGADGVFRPFLTRVMPVRDPDGRVGGWFGTNTDISEQRAIEEELQRSRDELESRVEERTRELSAANQALAAQMEVRVRAEEALRRASGYHRSLLEASLDPLATIASDGKITDVNQATEKATGLSREALIGTDFSDYFTDPRKARAGYQQVFREGAVQDYALEIRHAGGHTTPVLYNASVYRDEAGRVAGVFAAARDITERKRAEQLLHDSEEKYRTLFNSIDEGFCTIEVLFDENQKPVDFRFLEVNPSFVKQTGIPDAPGKRMREIAPLHEEYWFEIYGGIALTGEPVRFQNRAAQFKRWYDVYAFRVGEPAQRRVAILFNDISERKRAEAALRESEEAFRTLAESMPQMVWVCDPDGLGVYYNQRWLDYTGLTLEESYGSGWNTPFHPDDRQAAWDTWSRAVETGGTYPYRIESRLRRADGAYRWFLTRGVPSRDAAGRIVKWFGTCTDIEDLKRAEEELRIAGDRLALALKVGHSGTFEWDLRNRTAIWPAEMEALHGLEPGAFGGTLKEWKALVVSEDIRNIYTAFEKSLQTGEFVCEWRIRRADNGEIRWIAARATISFDQDGRPLRVVGLNSDITERKQVEEEVQRLNAELERRVVERTVQLEATNKELEAFAYSVSHDLRAPLRALDGFCSALMSEYRDKIDTQGQHYLGRIQAASVRMGELINDLLNLSRVTRREFNRQDVDLSRLAMDVAAELQAQSPGRQAEFRIAPGLMAKGDPHLLRIVLENLLGNAWKFTRDTQTTCIEVGASEPDGEQVYFVRDNGVGFDMAYADKLFSPFQRLHGMQEFPGTGIGLATVQRIVNRHGGRIWPEAAVNRGATFCFTLQRAQ